MIGAIGSARDFEERYDRIPENARHGFTVALLLENLALYGTIGEVLRDFESKTMTGNGWAIVRICELRSGSGSPSDRTTAAGSTSACPRGRPRR